MKKRYYLFIMAQYYPCGGSGDLRAIHDSLEEAEQDPQIHLGDGYEILTVKDNKIVDAKTEEEIGQWLKK